MTANRSSTTTPRNEIGTGRVSAVAQLPLSSRQSLLWLDEQLYPLAHYANLVLTIELQGPLDIPRFSRAWAQTVANLDSLRVQVDSREAQQRFIEVEPPPLPVVPIPADELQPWLAERCLRELRGEGFLWDAALLQLATDRHLFYLCQHHIASDPSSMVLVAEHLSERYAGRQPAVAPSFEDYLEYEAQYRSSARSAEDQAYWNHALAAGAPPLRPYGLARSDRSVAVAREWLDRAEERARRLEAISQVEPFDTGDPWTSRLLVLATGTAAFLYRITGNREILLGLPVANRPAPFGTTCGLLMEQTFLRIAIEEGDTFASLARVVKEQLTQAMRHGQACIGQHGLEYVSLNFLPKPPPRFAELSASMRLEGSTTLGASGPRREGDLRDTLGITAFDYADGPLQLAVDFHQATFDQRIRRRACSHLLRVLDSMAANPQTALDSVDLVDEEERRTVLQASAGPRPPLPAPDFLEQFSQQVRRRATHPAVVGQDGTLTYAELEARSNQLARRLRTLGVGRESRVGVALPRGSSELATFVATLKAGGAYVPVDLSHPVDRVRLILGDAKPQVLVTRSNSPLANALPAGTQLLPLDDLTSATEGFEDSALDERPSPDQLAYILFTSGSTGRPKGVEILRGGIANFLRSVAIAPGLTENERWLAIATTTFDMSTLDLYLPLYVGATVVIADRETATDPKRLRQKLETDSISVLQATPAMWRLLIDAGWAGDGRLRMFAGGEALSPDLAAKMLERGAELWNLYGPTETTVYSTVEKVSRGERRIRVGRPIDWTQVYILDGALQLVPAGVVGEIFIGGAGLARGYHQRPDLTTERFVQSPFGTAGERLYRTGDLGLLLEDGRFECLGRLDHQVKIRGFRIELGEIESALRSVDGVQETVVVADEPGGGGEPRLIAYWVGGADQQALFEQARARLPAYMIPSAYVRLETFPLTPSGKVDRKQLPRPEVSVSTRREGRRPSNDTEVRMAAIWSDVLGVPSIGVDEDFFALGGSSVKVIQARARIEQEFGLDLPLRAFFETPTVAALVAKLGSVGSPDDPIIVRLRRGRPDIPPLFCLAGVQLYQDIAAAMGEERPVIGMHVPIRGVRGRDACPSIPEIASRYVEYIRREQAKGPYHLAGLCFGGFVAFEVARQLETMGERVPLVAIFDGYFPGAIRIDYLARIWTLMGRAIADPFSVPGKLEAKAQQIWSRISRPAPNTPRDGEKREELIDLLMDDAGALAEMDRYRNHAGRVKSHLVLFRALNPPPRAGAVVDPALGWKPLAARVSTHDVASRHLEIVREPHARTVARIITEAIAEGSQA